MDLTKAWSLVFDSRFDKKFDRLSHLDQKRIISFFENRVLRHANPREYAKPLKGDLSGYWSFRIGHYRVIADIVDAQLKIITFDVGHRREIYD